MSILINHQTKVLVQGITGGMAQFHTKEMLEYGTKVVAGLTAPKGRTMGHAGAIISAFGESASEKVEILSAAGVTIARHPADIGETIASIL